VCGYGDVAVDVTSEIDFDNVSCFEWFLCEGWMIESKRELLVWLDDVVYQLRD